jgi:hypothetical protein
MFSGIGEQKMKNITVKRAEKRIFFACLITVLAAGIISAQEDTSGSVREQIVLPATGQTIGSIQTSFTARNWDVWFNKKVIETQAYSKLLEAAQKKYPGMAPDSVWLDVRDIVWAEGKKINEMNREIAASGRIIQVPVDEAVADVVQASFTALSWDSWFNRSAIKTQAYIRLLEAAQQRNPGMVDIEDIVWTSGRMVDFQNKEIIAIGKVVKVN